MKTAFVCGSMKATVDLIDSMLTLSQAVDFQPEMAKLGLAVNIVPRGCASIGYYTIR